MYAWVTLDKDRPPYLSTIFARAIHKGNWGKYEEGYHEYCVVLNENKNKLISVDTYQKGDKNIEVHIATVTADMEHWIPKKYYGSFDFLKKYDPETLSSTISQVDLQKCIEIDRDYHYQEWHEIRTEKDAEILLDLSGDFHDAFIDELDVNKDQMIIKFGKAWGIQMELIFDGNPTYKLDPDIDYYTWWSDCSLIFDDGYWYLCDLPEVKSIPKKSEDLPSMYFAGRRMRYRILPGCYESAAERKTRNIKIVDNR